MAWSEEEGDQELVQLMRSDPEQGFSLLLQQLGGRIYGYLRNRFPSLDEMQLQDALTDAALALLQSFDPSRGSLAAWFLLLAHQQATRVLRGQRDDFSPLDAPDEVQPGENDPLSDLLTLERIEQLHNEIERLPGLEQQVVKADLDAGRTECAEGLAERFSTSVGSVYAARRRGRAKLAERCRWVGRWLQQKRSDHE